MKNVLLAATLITLTFLSCSKDDTPQDPDTIIPPNTTIYEGTWRGNLIPTSSGAVPTTWVMNVTGDGQVNQTHENTHGPGTGIGTITEDGILSLTYDGGGTETERWCQPHRSSAVVGHPIVYLPGHYGSYIQSRSLGAHGIQLPGRTTTSHTHTGVQV